MNFILLLQYTYSEIKYLFLLFLLTKKGYAIIIISVTANGEVAQLARAFGSYPKGHVFESHLRYQQKRTVYKNSSFFMYFNKNNGKGRKKFFINKNCNFMK